MTDVTMNKNLNGLIAPFPPYGRSLRLTKLLHHLCENLDGLITPFPPCGRSLRLTKILEVSFRRRVKT